MYSAVPLSPATLVAGVCQDSNTNVIDAVDINIDFVLDACQNLIVVDSQPSICRFSHLSVQEYLEKHWSSHDANALIAKVCLSLLNDSVQQKRDTESQDGNKEFNDIVRYARYLWADHVQNHGEESIDSRLSTILKQFLGSLNESGPAYKSWQEMIAKDVHNYDFFLSTVYIAVWSINFVMRSVHLHRLCWQHRRLGSIKSYPIGGKRRFSMLRRVIQKMNHCYRSQLITVIFLLS